MAEGLRSPADVPGGPFHVPGGGRRGMRPEIEPVLEAPVADHAPRLVVDSSSSTTARPIPASEIFDTTVHPYPTMTVRLPRQAPRWNASQGRWSSRGCQMIFRLCPDTGVGL